MSNRGILPLLFLTGAACFFAGRFSAHQNNPVKDPIVSTQNVAARIEPAVGTIAAANQTTHLTPSSDWSEDAWHHLLSQPATLARNAELAAMLEKLAVTDPKRAMALAHAEDNLNFRKTLEQAALRGWARTAPMDAAGWAMTSSNASEREASLATVFAGAILSNPDEAIRVGNFLIKQNPGDAAGYGTTLIDALCNAGDFDAAAQMAGSGDGGTQRSIWMAEAYSKWALLQPEAAAQAASAIGDPAIRDDALHGIIGGWAEANPAALTEFLSELPPASDRGQMIGQGLESWVQADPVAAANWINSNASNLGSDLDAGMQAVAMLGQLQPTTATAWAENISDPQLRSQALTDILRNWIQTDPTAARNYFQTTQNLLPADRQQISQIIAGADSISASQ